MITTLLASRPHRSGFVWAEALEPRKLLAADVAYDWDTVTLNGGGYALHVIVHPSDSNVRYLRSDTGASRWDATANKWEGISDTMTDPSYWPTSSLAIDPSDATKQVVYVAGGNRFSGTGQHNGEIFKSTDGGRNWTASGLKYPGTTTRVKIGGGDDSRQKGERLAVDPNSNGQVLFFGSAQDGLWRSGAASSPGSWAPVAAFTEFGVGPFGVQSIAFDKNGGTTTVNNQTVSRIAYAGVRGRADDPATTAVNEFVAGGIHYTNNGGQTWSKIASSPWQVNQMTVDANGTLWVADDAGVFAAGRPTGTNAPVLVNKNFTGRAKGIDSLDGNTAIITTGYSVRRTTNGSAASPTWTVLVDDKSTANIDRSDSPWINQGLGAFGSAVMVTIDPNNANRAWTSDYYRVWRTDNLSATTPTFISDSNGYESIVSIGVSSQPAGGNRFVHYFSDVGGVTYGDLGQAPNPGRDTTKAPFIGLGDTSGYAFSEGNVNFQAFVGEGNRRDGAIGGYTVDGTNWLPFGAGGAGMPGLTYGTRSTTYHQGKVAVGARGPGGQVPVAGQPSTYPNMVYVPGSQHVPRYATFDAAGNISWNDSTGALPGMGGGYQERGELVAADASDPNLFYLTYGNTDVYRSTDGGRNWSKVNRVGIYGAAGGVINDVRAMPLWVDGSGATRGRREVWVGNWGQYNNHNGQDGGLFRSTDAATGLTRVANIDNVQAFSFGKPAPGRSNPALYVLGRVNANGTFARGIFRSDDATATTTADAAGATWVKIYDSATYATGINHGEWLRMAADRQTYGRVYVGTLGRGAWVGEISGTSAPAVPTAPANLSAAAGNAQVSLSWSAVSGASTFNVYRSTTSGSGYSKINGSAVSGTTYTDTGRTNGTAYHYVVRAVNTAGESGNSNQATATPVAPPVATSSTYFEAEAYDVSPWTEVSDMAAFGGKYIVTTANTSSVPTDGQFSMPFSGSGSFNIWTRVHAPTVDDDSIYFKVDNGGWNTWNNMNSASGFSWKKWGSTFNLAAGSHTLTIAYRESGTRIDRFLVTNDASLTPSNAVTATAVKFSGTVIGTSGSYNSLGNTRDKVFDSDLTTFFDGPAASGNWVGLNLGSAKTITQIKYAARSGQSARMNGGYFQASNTANFSSGNVTLYMIGASENPPSGSFTTRNVSVAGTYQYVRYVAPDNSWGNVAELELWGY
ncbi:MAG TPA: fibronectin type III domain-containing protein [Tepidisphaeraceae bacterium]|jgi:hypothetical protein|nr:fibronectin type III domain-containing protein [Tepidisphaeraceae bacterium]